MTGRGFLLRLRAGQAGNAITEFGLIAPVFMALVLGVMDLGHTLYMQSTIQGALQKAARDSSLESASNTTTQTSLDTAFSTQVKRLAQNATVTVTRTYFRDYTKASVSAKEPFTDTNSNGTCNAGEPYEDSNNSGSWDNDNGRTGQGSAKDTTVVSAAVVYPRMFPFLRIFGLPANVTINASTVLVNQPYGDQAAVTVRNCT
ncbi:MAG: TadE family protein [Sphingobium sp.]